MLNIIAGVEPSDAGQITVAGQRIDQLNDAQRRRFRAQHIGFVFQALELVEYLNVRDNILLPFDVQLGGSRPPDYPERLQQLLQHTSLADRAYHLPHQLSQGQRQRAALCRALITRPSILLADEPTGSLDSRTTDEVLELMFEQIQQHSTTLVMVTHDDRWLDRFDRVIRLDDKHC